MADYLFCFVFYVLVYGVGCTAAIGVNHILARQCLPTKAVGFILTALSAAWFSFARARLLISFLCGFDVEILEPLFNFVILDIWIPFAITMFIVINCHNWR